MTVPFCSEDENAWVKADLIFLFYRNTALERDSPGGQSTGVLRANSQSQD